MPLLIWYLLILNLIGFLLCGVDKRAAVKHRWRIPERTLFLVSLLGGSIGFYLGMFLFHHKTRHKRFLFGIPAILLLQLAAACLAVYLSK